MAEATAEESRCNPVAYEWHGGQPAFSANEPGRFDPGPGGVGARFGDRFSVESPFAHHPDGHGSRFAHGPGHGGSNAGSPTYAHGHGYADGVGYERRDSVGSGREGLSYSYAHSTASEYEYDYADSEHSGTSGPSVGGSIGGSVSGGSRPASSAGVDGGGTSEANGRIKLIASLAFLRKIYVCKCLEKQRLFFPKPEISYKAPKWAQIRLRKKAIAMVQNNVIY
ncbi:hypothetical protein B0H13DRAFT_1860257 [Mycena leptocephala]|nr:hypothetical protein B0H13DRAFT_1860257 [Mycena leptocephala]